MPQQKKKAKKKGGGRRRPHEDGPAAAAEAAARQEAAARERDKAKEWLEAERAEIEHMEAKMTKDSGWSVRRAAPSGHCHAFVAAGRHPSDPTRWSPYRVSFTLSKAPWLSFSTDKSIDAALDDSYIGGSDEVVARWMHRAERCTVPTSFVPQGAADWGAETRSGMGSSIIYWIINKIIEQDGRAELFRPLGRGWIFILLRRPQRKFKWSALHSRARIHARYARLNVLPGPCPTVPLTYVSLRRRAFFVSGAGGSRV
jgi:hypothetical protein